MDTPIIAVIDIGSNSIRLQVSKVLDRTYKVIEEYKETVRIGDNVFRTGSFSEDAIETITGILSRMKNMMDFHKVEQCRAVATASFREASNAAEVVERLKREIGIDIEVISGIEEARLMSLAASAYFQLTDGSTLLIDMGGGSTEYSYFAYGELKMSESTPLGCSKLTYEYFKNDPVLPEEVKALKAEINRVTDPFLPLYGVDKLVCTGGTLNNLSVIYNKRNNMSDSAVKFVDSVFVKHFISEISGKKIADRLKISGVEAARADMILSAALLVQSLIKRYRLDGFYTMSGGLRTGLTIDVMNKIGMEMMFQGESGANLRYSRLLETGKKYCFEEAHALQVTRLCEKIFKGLRDYLKLTDNDWHTLEAASLLHDVGQYIAYARHHKHSYYLITNTELAGYTAEDAEIIANIARYHRRGMPKNSHSNFMGLTPQNKEKVVKLSAILRIADGFDRSHGSLVKDLTVEVKPERIEFTLFADDDVSMEKQGFDKKKDLLQALCCKDAVVV